QANGASLSLTAGRTLAEKGDLVPFVAVVGVPASAAALAAPTLSLQLTSGLRASDVLITAADGSRTTVKPSEAMGALAVPLPALAAGQQLSLRIRARVTGRAKLSKEGLTATLSD